MAAPAPASDAVARPLSEFHKISHNTYLYTPAAYTAASPLILFFTWQSAAAKHIAKYTDAYRRLFPSARILLVRCDFQDMFTSDAAFSKLAEPALAVVRAHTQSGGAVLAHSSSNGGANQVGEFARAWKKSEGARLPLRAQVLDSSPGRGSWARSHAAVAAAFPKTLLLRVVLSGALHVFLAGYYAFITVTGSENRMVTIGRQLNDAALFDTWVPRVYLYSEADEMVGVDEVEGHADDAAQKGWDVTKVRFENSPHAGHIREDEDKYWGAVMEAWKAGPRM
ncbi:indole-diterpene biosynthesis protein-like protein PaxU [Massariosphaeria phaeospora]|uniref:Indole-diterpene biosynthesis protein-like protein PaxU n=1 Tax=Massariosphaeria phaeospora TaxID=100035 RepID=A0A7C8I5C1_9PLEO|nr:indole-diterpene biosynthesis protein-like protein PaxU [Massariosphaeria phaeospora]